MSIAQATAAVVRANASALVLCPAEDLTPSQNLLLVLAHAFGLFALARYFHVPLLIGVALAVAFLLAGILAQRAAGLTAAWLAPLFAVYGLLVVRYVYIRVLGQSVSGYFDYALPDWTLPFLYVDFALFAACFYAVAMLASALVHSRSRVLTRAATVILATSSAWAAFAYLSGRSHGATGSDPYAYVQMGVDLATRGTPAHLFELFAQGKDLSLSWYPLLHVGYRLPFDNAGSAITVWPPGGAAAFAIAYRALGEQALYWVNPLFSLLSVLLAGLLSWELTRGHRHIFRLLCAAAVVALCATAHEQVVWSAVTMVDAQAEFSSLAAVWLALKFRYDGQVIYAALAGVALGAAYDVRHTQLVLALGLLILIAFGLKREKRRLVPIVLCAAAALFVALPDLWYHEIYLGSWLRPESEELALYSAAAVATSAERFAQQLFAAYEFGWLAPFLACGAVLYARRRPIEFGGLAAWLIASLALHLPYAALRLRDLLPEFPAVAFLCAYGIVALVELIGRAASWPRRASAGLIVFAALDLCLLRVRFTAIEPWQVRQLPFGYVTESQRGAFNALSAVTSPAAVVGSSLNDGAVELYAHRATFRPDGWSPAERREFLSRMIGTSRSVYMVEDSAAMSEVIAALQAEFRLTRVSDLDMPLFGEGEIDHPGTLWKIESSK